MFYPSLLLVTGLAFQQPQTVSSTQPVSNTTQTIANTPAAPAPIPVSPELRCDIMMARKMYRDAVDCFKAGADKSAVWANKTGIAYHQLADLDNARKYYERAVKLDPKYAEAINNVGTIYYAKKSYRRAISQYHKALTLRPDSASFMANLGTAYFARKQYTLASMEYVEALRIDPEIFEHRNNQGTTIQDQSVEERAKYHYYVAKTYAEAGVRDRALQYIRKSLEEGFKDRQKYLKEPEFALLRDDPEFKELMATEQKVL